MRLVGDTTETSGRSSGSTGAWLAFSGLISWIMFPYSINSIGSSDISIALLVSVKKFNRTIRIRYMLV